MKYCISLLLLALAQEKAPKDAGAKMDRVRVDGAIEKGIAYLRQAQDPKCTELLLLTLLHAGYRENDPDVQRLLKTMLDGKPVTTYTASVQAMALEELDRVKYQRRILQCAQFLVDNQGKDGLWGYGTPTTAWDAIKTKEVATSGSAKPVTAGGERRKPKVVTRIAVKATRVGQGPGDSSNSQYAALGIRACHESGILFPAEVIERARKAWADTQRPDEDKKGGTEARGWGYYGDGSRGSYGSMTAGGLAAVCIYDHILGQAWTKDPVVEKARTWMTLNFSATENPHAPRGWDGYETTAFVYYYLYAMERAGLIYGTETFGTHTWYVEGATYILDTQKPDGSWVTPSRFQDGGPVADTCFAILFLRRSTTPLTGVASEDRFFKK
jgi:hypothetical protein